MRKRSSELSAYQKIWCSLPGLSGNISGAPGSFLSPTWSSVGLVSGSEYPSDFQYGTFRPGNWTIFHSPFIKTWHCSSKLYNLFFWICQSRRLCHLASNRSLGHSVLIVVFPALFSFGLLVSCLLSAPIFCHLLCASSVFCEVLCFLFPT